MRGLSESFMQDLLAGELKGFLSIVQSDDTLDLEIRDKYVNIYYRGGNLCRVVVRNNKYRMEFDERYAKTDEHKAFIENKGEWSIDLWVKNIPYLKAIMDKNGPPSVEKEFQQLVVWENNRSRVSNDTDYYIADIEYQMALTDVDGKQRQRRLDMVAVRWPSTSGERKNKKNLGLAFIEVKYGDGALSDVAGIVEHIKDWNCLLNDAKKWNDLREDALRVFNQKVQLGLVRGIRNGVESVSDKPPELILLIANHKPRKTTLANELRKVCDSETYKALCNYGCALRIATSSFMGYGLYKECVAPLERFMGEA